MIEVWNFIKKYSKKWWIWFSATLILGFGRYIQENVTDMLSNFVNKSAIERSIKCDITVEYAEGDCWYYDNEMLIHYHTRNFKSEPYRVRIIGQPTRKGGAEQQFVIEGWQTIDPDKDWHHIPQMWDQDNWFKWPNRGVQIDDNFMKILRNSDIDIIVATQRCDGRPDYQRVCTISINDIIPYMTQQHKKEENV